MKKIFFILISLFIIVVLNAQDFDVNIIKVNPDKCSISWNRFDSNANFFVVLNGNTTNVNFLNATIGPKTITTTVNYSSSEIRHFIQVIGKGQTYTAYSQYITITPKPADNIQVMGYRDFLSFNDNILHVSFLTSVSVGNNITMTSFPNYDVYITEIVVSGNSNGIVEVSVDGNVVRHYAYLAYGFSGQIFSTPLKIPQNSIFKVKLVDGQQGNHAISYSYYIKK